MGYCAKSDILEQLDEDVLQGLTDDDDAGVVDDDKVNRAIADADAEINSYCKKFKLPFSPVPARIRALSVDISVYRLFSRRKGAPDDRRQTYEDAIAFLKDVAKGRAGLGVQPPPEAAGEDDYAGATRVSARTKIFDTHTMDKY